MLERMHNDCDGGDCAACAYEEEWHARSQGEPLPESGPTERVKAIRRAAVAFANDHGPLPAANTGDEDASDQVAGQLMKALRKESLTIEIKRT